MKKTASLALLVALGACDLPAEDWDLPQASILVSDHEAMLSGSDSDPLFVIKYCPESKGPTFFVSDMTLELSEQGLGNYPSVRFELVKDLNRDNRFGPGDEVLVTEKSYDSLDEDDVGTYKVIVRDASEFPEPLIGEADWSAR